MNAPLPTPAPRERIAEFICTFPLNTVSEIASKLKLPETRVANEINALRTEGLIDCERAGTPAKLRYRASVSRDEMMSAVTCGTADAINLPADIKPGSRKAQIWYALRDGKRMNARQLCLALHVPAGTLDPTISEMMHAQQLARSKAGGIYVYFQPGNAMLAGPVDDGSAADGKHAPASIPSAAQAAEDDADEEMPPADPDLLASANRMLADRLDGVAHVLRGCGLEALRNVTGCEDLQPHVAALSGAYQMALQKIDVLSNERHDFLRSAHTTIEAASEWLAEVVEGGDIEASEMSVEELAMRAAGELKNARALVEKLEHLLQAARNEAEHLRAHGAADRNMVDHPPHYTAGGIECIDAIESALGPDGFAAYCRGNAIKYAWRAGLKGSAAQDLAKGAWYLARCAGRDRDSQAEARP